MKQYLLPVAFIFLLCISIGAKTIYPIFVGEELSKTIEKEFPISSDGTATLENAHGEIVIKTWTESKVKIVVEVKLEARNEKIGQEALDAVEIDFSNTNSQVSAKTVYQSGWRNNWRNDVRNRTVNYDVYVPATVQLKIKQSHGKVMVADMASNVNYRLSHANLEAGNCKGKVDLNMSHGNGTIGSAGEVDLDLSHANIKANEVGDAFIDCQHGSFRSEIAGNVSISSGHSRFEIDEAISITANQAGHDRFRAQKVKTLKIHGNHSTVNVDQVLASINIDLGHGNVNTNLGNGFTAAEFTGSHTNFDIGVASNASFAMEAYGSHAGIRYPKSMEVPYYVEKNNSKEIKGTYGNASSQNVLKARLSHGSLDLFVK